MFKLSQNFDFAYTEIVNGAGFTKIPYKKIGNGKQEILITAGMDGDEYASMTAAIRLITFYEKNPVDNYAIYIFPVVNTLGLACGMSQNPIDGLYPKHIYPGKSKGSSSEIMIASIFEAVKKPKLWIDLHSGALQEKLTPFVWGFKTGVKKQDLLTKKILLSCNSHISLYTHWKKADLVAKNNCCYVLFESGDQGKVRDLDVDSLVNWTKQSIEAISKAVEHNYLEPFYVYTNVEEYSSSTDGYWLLKSNSNGVFSGELRVFKTNREKQIMVKKQGLKLWNRIDGFINRNDVILALANNLKRL